MYVCLDVYVYVCVCKCIRVEAYYPDLYRLAKLIVKPDRVQRNCARVGIRMCVYPES